MPGQLPPHTKVYDNAAKFAPSIPTYARYLTRRGCQSILAGKMHYAYSDQLHRFETRTTTDVYPVDFGWTPDYRKPDELFYWDSYADCDDLNPHVPGLDFADQDSHS